MQSVSYSEDLRVAKQSVASTSAERVTTARCASRLRTEANRVVMVWELITEKKGSVLQGSAAMQVLQKGAVGSRTWLLLRTGVRVHTSILRDCGPNHPERFRTRCEEQRPHNDDHYRREEAAAAARATDASAAHRTDHLQQTAQNTRRTIENALFDEMLLARTRPNGAPASAG